MDKKHNFLWQGTHELVNKRFCTVSYSGFKQ